jgi:peptide deformylase
MSTTERRPSTPGVDDGLPILIAPHPALRAKTRRVGTEDLALVRDLLPRLFATMYAAPGIGLAAPQVGVGLRLAVVDLQPDDKPAPMVLINPEIVAASDDEAVREEGCLSLPGHYADVSRPARVRVRHEDETGARHEFEADGLLAACVQHELDHLDGILFVDHLTPLRRNMILRKLAKEQKAKAAG